MPDFPIVDAHVHLWDPARFRIPWLDGNALLDRRYLLDEYRAHTAGVEVEAMVYLQVEVAPAYGLLEAQFVADLARDDPRIKAIVAWAPLEDGARARSYLEALVTISPLIRGVRRIVQGESDPNFCLRPDLCAACSCWPTTGFHAISASTTRSSARRSSWCGSAHRCSSSSTTWASRRSRTTC